MFWADEIATTVIKSRDKDVYHMHDYKTPSGRVHVGSLCGVVVHDVVTRAIKAQGKKAQFTWGYDDYDPMDGFPVYLPEEFRQYMGKPLSEIPSPEPGHASYARYFADEFTAVFQSMGIEPEIIWGSELYKSGKFNDAIRLTLDNAATIRKIYNDISGSERPNDWYALNVVCPNCGKIGTTRIYAWDGEQVSFKCEPNMVKWAQGCGFEGRIDPFDGRAKMPWKVEWAAKWAMYENDFETAGKDHMTKNGSFDVASAVVKEVFGKEPPVGRQFPYEWLLINGKKMSSSKGVGNSAKEVAEAMSPHLLHFLIAKKKPSRHLNFNLDGMTVPALYDEYDQVLAAFRTDPESDLAKIIAYSLTHQ